MTNNCNEQEDEKNQKEKEKDDWDHHVQVPTDEEENEMNNQYSAQQLREMANNYFSQQDYDTALPLYTMALEALTKNQSTTNELVPLDSEGSINLTRDAEVAEVKQAEKEKVALFAIFLCNRAACLFKMELYDDAKVDAEEALKISNGNNPKAAFRLSRARIALHDFSGAISTLEKALQSLSSLPTQTNPTNNESNEVEQSTELEFQRKELTKLLVVARTRHLQKEQFPDAHKLAQVQSIKVEPRQPSIREFDLEYELGAGNFSQVVICTHKVTKEQFALKIIEKKKAEQLAKRQHPNVYNEINMERRILGEKLGSVFGKNNGHKRIITLYHSFQNYNNLYFLMDLHVENGDLWKTLRYRNKMIGTHPSLIKIYLFEILDALEHCHKKGVVHRDIKPENILLSSRGHIILIDFGTAKDLIQTDLNGPEFVGTPDFMAPEAIKGTSDESKVMEAQANINSHGSDHSLDLWAFGAVAYYLLSGMTPFQSPSPYLTFLKIQRANLYRPLGILDDDAWNLISGLMRVKPQERLGADCFEYCREEDSKKVIKKSNGYDVIRNHSFFSGVCNVNECSTTEEDVTPIPSLRDLCIRSCADLVQNDSNNFNIDKENLPGDGSAHDMLRLKVRDRRSLMHVLDRLCLLREPRVYRRFYETKQDARLKKVRDETHDYMGLTQINDKQGQFPVAEATEGMEDMDMTVTMGPIQIFYVGSPLFIEEINLGCTNEELRKRWVSELKENLRLVNRKRPKAVVATGYIDDTCRKLLGKVNETIPVIVNGESSFFSFWVCGAQGIVLDTCEFLDDKVESTEAQNSVQMIWLREHLEQSKVTHHHLFIFVDCDHNKLPSWLLQKILKGGTLCLFSNCSIDENAPNEIEYTDTPEDADIDDDMTVSSDESESNECKQEKKDSTMKIFQMSDSSVLCITVEDDGIWKSDKI